MSTFTIAGRINGWTFYQVTGHGFTSEWEGKALYAFGDGSYHDSGSRDGEPKVGEYYGSLEHAMVAAVAEKYTGPRGAGGTGVGTAADWFMRMIGVGQLREAGAEGGRALMEAVTGSWGDAHKIESALDTKGYVIARKAVD